MSHANDLNSSHSNTSDHSVMSPRAKKLVESNSDFLDGLGMLKKHKCDIALEQVYESVPNLPKNGTLRET